VVLVGPSVPELPAGRRRLAGLGLLVGRVVQHHLPVLVGLVVEERIGLEHLALPELRAVQAVLPDLVVPWVLARLEVRLGLADRAVLAVRRHLLVLVGLGVLAGLVGKACTVEGSLARMAVLVAFLGHRGCRVLLAYLVVLAFLGLQMGLEVLEGSRPRTHFHQH